jgi:hypothetical protein
MSSPKLQLCLELCRFIQGFLKTKLQDRNCINLSELARDPIIIFFWMDGVLFEVRNKKWCCVWSLIATNSRIITLSMSPFQDSTDLSIIMFVLSPSFTIEYCCCIPNSTRVHFLNHATIALCPCSFASDIMYPLCFYIAKWVSFLTIHQSLFLSPRSYTEERCHPSTLGWETWARLPPYPSCRKSVTFWKSGKVNSPGNNSFYSEYSTKLIGRARLCDEAKDDYPRFHEAHTQEEKLHGRPQSFFIPSMLVSYLLKVNVSWETVEFLHSFS